MESCADYSVWISVKSGNAKRALRHFILACTDQESGEARLRGSKWTGESHEIRSISEYNGLVFFLVSRRLSRKTPGFSTICGDLVYSIAYELARKQGNCRKVELVIKD